MISQSHSVQVVPDLHSLYNTFLRFNCIPTGKLTPGMRPNISLSHFVQVVPDLHSLYNTFLRFNYIPTGKLTFVIVIFIQ